MEPSGKVYVPMPWNMLFLNPPLYVTPEGNCRVPLPCICGVCGEKDKTSVTNPRENTSIQAWVTDARGPLRHVVVALPCPHATLQCIQSNLLWSVYQHQSSPLLQRQTWRNPPLWGEEKLKKDLCNVTVWLDHHILTISVSIWKD